VSIHELTSVTRTFHTEQALAYGAQMVGEVMPGIASLNCS
jgi:succinyl-CoA synthetase alpha subunit